MAATSRGDDALVERVCRHLEPHFGEASVVYHDRVNEWVHVDVHVVLPADPSGTTVLFTTGMSERYMTAPPSVPRGAYARTAELVMRLPGRWPTSEESLTDPRLFWPYGWLRYLARYPFKYKTFFASGHSLELAHDSASPVIPCPFAGVLLRYPVELGKSAVMARGDGPERTVFLAVLPLLESELRFVEAHGSRALIERAAASGIDLELADVARPAVV
jgi:hypothetical protein